MRKILLATTALVGFAVAGAAQAATAPLNVTVGGDVNFIAGTSHESKDATKGISLDRANLDFETLYSLNFGITGKAASGIEYGGNRMVFLVSRMVSPSPRPRSSCLARLVRL